MTALLRTLGLAALVATSAACKSKLPTTTLHINDHAVIVEIAADGETRAQGLMHRDKLGTNKGMLFVYPDVKPRAFWMKNTRIPLSIAYVDASGEIKRIADMKPLDTSRTPSLYPVKYALEVNKGWFEAHGIEAGDTVTDLPEVDPT